MNEVLPATKSKAEKRADDGPSSTLFRSIERGGRMPANIIHGLRVVHVCYMHAGVPSYVGLMGHTCMNT